MDVAETNHNAKLRDLESIWKPLDPHSSEIEYQSILPDAEKLTGETRGYLIELLSLIARSEVFQDKLTQARASLSAAERVLQDKAINFAVTSRLRWLLEMGRLYISEKTPSQARILFAEAWTLASANRDDGFSVEIAQLMASVEPQKSQLEWILRAIKIAEISSSEKARRWLGGLYTIYGWKLYDLRQFEKSLDTFKVALNHFKSQGTAREAFVAQWSIGKVTRVLGKTEEALAIQKQLLSDLGIGGERDGRLYEELAECLQKLSRTTEAQLYFELAYRELSNDTWVADNQPLKLKRMKDLGKVKN